MPVHVQPAAGFATALSGDGRKRSTVGLELGLVGFFLQELEKRGLVTTMISGGGTGVSIAMEGYLRFEELPVEDIDDQVLGAKAF